MEDLEDNTLSKVVELPELKRSQEALSETIVQQYYNAKNSILEAQEKISMWAEHIDKLEELYRELTGESLSTTKAPFVHEQLDLDEGVDSITLMNDALIRQKRRWWRHSSFEGWKVFTINKIKQKNELLALSDFLMLAGESEKEERALITSAISNALSTSLRDGKLAAVHIKGIKKRYYGITDFFEGHELKPEYLEKLKYNMRPMLVELESIVIYNN